LTPVSIKQKYAQTVVSTRIVPGCVQFLGEEKAFLHSLDPLQTTGFRLAATRRPRPRRSSISPNGQNQAVKEAPEQIVAQLNGARHRPSDWPGQ